MRCPLNGLRNASEFVFGGDVVEPPPEGAPGKAWAEHVFLHDNAAGVAREWWQHVPTSYWFIAERDRRTDEVLRTYPASELFETRP